MENSNTRFVQVKIPEYILPCFEEVLEECMEFAFNDYEETQDPEARARYEAFCELQSAIAKFSRGPNAMTYVPITKEYMDEMTNTKDKPIAKESTWSV